MVAMAFSAGRGGTYVPSLYESLAIQPLHGGAEIIVEQNNQDPEAWYVRLQGLYFPSVNTEEGLRQALAKAWAQQRNDRPYLSRSIEEPIQILPADLPQISALRQTLRDTYHDEKGS